MLILYHIKRYNPEAPFASRLAFSRTAAVLERTEATCPPNCGKCVLVRNKNFRDCFRQDGDAQDGEATTSPSPAVPVVLPPPPPAPKDVTEQSFRVEKTYNLLSVDGQRVLSASNRKSDRQNEVIYPSCSDVILLGMHPRCLGKISWD